MAGRPRAFDRDVALQTAVEQFWLTGYDQTTVAVLTAAMGITAPSLYAAFGDKDQLFGEAAACYAARTEAGLADALDQPTAAAGLAEMMALTAAAHVDPRTPRGCFVLTEPRLADRREELRELIDARIARGIVDGDVPADVDPAALSAYLLSVMVGMSARARDGASDAEVCATARFALGALPWAAQAEPGMTSPLS